MIAKSERFEMRLDEDTLEQVDQWRARQADVPSRSEAMRRLVERGLATSGSSTVKISDGERLILQMMGDLYKQLKIGSNGDIDPEFVSDVLCGGHYWALKWELSGLYHDHEDKPEDVSFVVDVLDMWDRLEYASEKLSKKDRERVDKESAPFDTSVRFEGFDGNHESSHMSIACFLVEKMNRFQRFSGRELNSHTEMIPAYERMLKVFRPMRGTLAGRGLGASEITAILGAMKHPDARA